MTVTPLGKIASVTAGTPVRVTATPTPCQQIIVSPAAANIGPTYFGTSTLVKSTLVGVIKQFLKPSTSGIIDPLIITAPEGNQLNAADYWIDADNATDGLLVSYATE